MGHVSHDFLLRTSNSNASPYAHKALTALKCGQRAWHIRAHTSMHVYARTTCAYLCMRVGNS